MLGQHTAQKERELETLLDDPAPAHYIVVLCPVMVSYLDCPTVRAERTNRKSSICMPFHSDPNAFSGGLSFAFVRYCPSLSAGPAIDLLSALMNNGVAC